MCISSNRWWVCFFRLAEVFLCWTDQWCFSSNMFLFPPLRTSKVPTHIHIPKNGTYLWHFINSRNVWTRVWIFKGGNSFLSWILVIEAAWIFVLLNALNTSAVTLQHPFMLFFPCFFRQWYLGFFYLLSQHCKIPSRKFFFHWKIFFFLLKRIVYRYLCSSFHLWYFSVNDIFHCTTYRVCVYV